MPPRRNPEEHLERDLDELEERIERLDTHIDDARSKLDRLARDDESGASVPVESDDSA